MIAFIPLNTGINTTDITLNCLGANTSWLPRQTTLAHNQYFRQMHKKVLIVDDSETSLLLFESIFEGSGIQILSEADSNKAKDRIKMIKPDLIILDLMMPGVSGFSLLEVIKNDQETKNIPVMILSAIQENTTIKKAIQCGAAGYMKKPMNVEEVMKIIIKTLKD